MKTNSISSKISAWKQQIKTPTTWWRVVEEFIPEMESFLESSKAISAESESFIKEATIYLEFSVCLTNYAELKKIDCTEDSRWEKFDYALTELLNKLSSTHLKLRKSD